MIKIGVAAVEATAAADESSCQSFIAALLMLMGSIEKAHAMLVYGEFWCGLATSTVLLPFLLQYRASGDLSVTSLLLHAYCGSSSTALESPPAPSLPPGRSELWSSRATKPLLDAIAMLLDHAGPAADKSLVPLVESTSFWRALAVRNPETLESDGPIRLLFPASPQVQTAVGRAVIERLRPTRDENATQSERLRGAFKFILLAGDEKLVSAKLDMLCHVGKDLVASARDVARRTGWSSGHGYYAQDKDTGPKNPEAVQLLRVLQVVASLGNSLAESWSWSRDWLGEVCSRKERRKWEGQGLVMQEVEDVRMALKGPGGEALPAEPEPSASDVFIILSGAGTEAANGRYFFQFEDDGNPFYRHEDNPCLTLSQQENSYGDIRWVIEMGGESLYVTCFVWSQRVDSPFPPMAPHEWTFLGGDEPSPSLEVIPIDQNLQLDRGTSGFSTITAGSDDLYDVDDGEVIVHGEPPMPPPFVPPTGTSSSGGAFYWTEQGLAKYGAIFKSVRREPIRVGECLTDNDLSFMANNSLAPAKLLERGEVSMEAPSTSTVTRITLPIPSSRGGGYPSGGQSSMSGGQSLQVAPEFDRSGEVFRPDDNPSEPDWDGFK